MLILLKRSEQIHLSVNKRDSKWIMPFSLLRFIPLLFTVLVCTKLKIGLKVISCMCVPLKMAIHFKESQRK